VWRNPRNVQGATCNVHRARCRVQRAACDVQRAACGVQSATCSVRGATRRVQGATCQAQRVYRAEHGARGTMHFVRCILHVAPCTTQSLVLVNRADLPSAVITAIRTHAVRRLRLVTVRAFAQPNRLQRVVRTAFRRPRLGVPSFRIRHRSVSHGCLRVWRTASLGSSQSRLHSHVPRFRFVPHTEQSPKQPSPHSGFIGRAK
jgi:hypothetical protein